MASAARRRFRPPSSATPRSTIRIKSRTSPRTPQSRSFSRHDAVGAGLPARSGRPHDEKTGLVERGKWSLNSEPTGWHRFSASDGSQPEPAGSRHSFRLLPHPQGLFFSWVSGVAWFQPLFPRLIYHAIWAGKYPPLLGAGAAAGYQRKGTGVRARRSLAVVVS